jgi:hypothetical protein
MAAGRPQCLNRDDIPRGFQGGLSRLVERRRARGCRQARDRDIGCVEEVAQGTLEGIDPVVVRVVVAAPDS